MSVNLMRSSDFRNIVAPILNKTFDNAYEIQEDEAKQIFMDENGIERSYHEEVEKYGFNAAQEIPEGMPAEYQAGGQLFVKRYQYKVFGTSYAMTQVLVEDGDHVRLGKEFAEHAGISMTDTVETTNANILNRAFNSSYLGGDGVVLCSASHPIIGGTYSNVLTTPATLSQTSLEQMLTQILGAVNNNGMKMRLKPKELVVSPANWLQAEVLLNSVLRTNSANNDLNPIKSLGDLKKAVKISRLTSNTAWFIHTDARNGLKNLWRRKPKKTMEGDFETDSMRYKLTMRYADGYTNPRTIFGTAGI